MELFPRSLQLPQFPACLLSTIEDLSTKKSFICGICQEHFMTSRGLEIHSNKIHINCPKTSVCSVCSKSFKNKYLLTAHHKQVHEAGNRVSCSRCEKDFCNKSTLQKHMKKKHLPVVNIN